MAAASNTNQIMYSFRFGKTVKTTQIGCNPLRRKTFHRKIFFASSHPLLCISKREKVFDEEDSYLQIDEEQLQHFPYLVALVERSEDFISNRNQNGEYILDDCIRYSWFLPIFRAITQQQPSILFAELPSTCNVLGMLQLYDYLCIKPLPLPRFEDDELVRTNPTIADENEKYVKFVRANVGEARNLAAQFMMAISKNEYDLNDLRTKDEVFSLIKVILSNPKVFNIKFRYHTLKIVTNYCYASFSKEQKKEIPTVKRIKQMKTTEFCGDNGGSLPYDFRNKLARKLVKISKEEYDAIHAPSVDLSDFLLNNWYSSEDMDYSGCMIGTHCNFGGRYSFHNSRKRTRGCFDDDWGMGTRCIF